MLAYVDKTAKCSTCGKGIHLLIEGRKEDWVHPGLVPGAIHEATPDRATIQAVGQ